MKRILGTSALVLALLCGVAVSAAHAQRDSDEAAAAPGAEAAAEAPACVAVTVTGENYCLITALAADQAENALPACRALKVAEAKDADGNDIASLKGKTLHYLPTKAAEALLTGSDGQVSVVGKLYESANVLSVESFEAVAAAGAVDEWDELPTTTLSGQQVL